MNRIRSVMRRPGTVSDWSCTAGGLGAKRSGGPVGHMPHAACAGRGRARWPAPEAEGAPGTVSEVSRPNLAEDCTCHCTLCTSQDVHISKTKLLADTISHIAHIFAVAHCSRCMNMSCRRWVCDGCCSRKHCGRRCHTPLCGVSIQRRCATLEHIAPDTSNRWCLPLIFEASRRTAYAVRNTGAAAVAVRGDRRCFCRCARGVHTMQRWLRVR
jgi:hypothetical protein